MASTSPLQSIADHGDPEWAEVRPRSVDEVLEVLHEASRSPDVACRGQAAAEWDDLQTSFDRATDADRSFGDLICDEVACLDFFRKRAPNFLSQEETGYLQTLLGTMQLLRHYGGPTRLLDWSGSPWVAAYFACQSFRIQGCEADGVVWYFHLNDLTAAQHGSGSAAGELAAIRAAVTAEQWGEAFRVAGDRVYVIHPDYENRRILAQQGMFTLSRAFHRRHDVLIARTVAPERRRKLIIAAGLKKQLVQTLATMNLTPTTLFPGPDGLGRAIEDALRWDLRRPVDETLRRMFPTGG